MTKMKIIWNGEAREKQEWVVDRHNPDWEVAYPVETATDWGWLQFLQRFDGMSPRAWRALLWALRKQDEIRLPLESVEITWSELDWEVMCRGCETWVSDANTHDCDYSAVLGKPDDEEPAEEEAPAKGKVKKKAGEPDPEA